MKIILYICERLSILRVSDLLQLFLEISKVSKNQSRKRRILKQKISGLSLNPAIPPPALIFATKKKFHDPGALRVVDIQKPAFEPRA